MWYATRLARCRSSDRRECRSASHGGDIAEDEKRGARAKLQDRPLKESGEMNDLLRLFLFLLAYLVLMKWVLPRLGVPTCLSGNCNAAWLWKRSTRKGHGSDHSAGPAAER